MPGQFSGSNLRIRMGGSDLNGRISGEQVFSTSVTPTVMAPVVGALTFEAITSNSITVRWTLSGDAPTTTVVDFGTSISYGQSVTLTDPTTTAVMISPLAANSEYFFRVTATNSAGSSFNTGSQSTAMVPEYTISGNITDSVSNASVSPSSYTLEGIAGSTHTLNLTITANSGYRFLSNADISFSGLGSSLELLNTNLASTTTITAQIRGTIGSSNISDSFSVNGSASLDVATPQVTTNAASNIQTTRMILNGQVDDDGGALITRRFFQWGTTTALGNEVDASGSVSFLASISSLVPGRTHYFRAAATNSSGLTGFGNTLMQDTEALQVPSVTTLMEQDLAQTTVTLVGQQTDTGGAAITERGFYYRTGSGQTLDPDNLTVWTKVTDDSTTGGIISEGVTGLTADTAYTYVAFATNSVGTGFGGSRSFTTREPIVLPSISSFTATADGQNAVNLAWTATAADRYELDYGLDRSYGTMVAVGNTDTSARVTGLLAGNRYFFRLRAFNDDGSDFAITDVTTDAGFAISALPVALEFDGDGNPLTRGRNGFDVTIEPAGAAFSVSNNRTWISTTTSGTTVTVTVDSPYEPAIPTERTGTVTVTHLGDTSVTATVEITQHAFV